MTQTTVVDVRVRMPKKMRDDLEEIARREFSSLNRETLVAVRAHIDAHKRGKK